MNKQQIVVVVLFGMLILTGIFLLINHFRVYPLGSISAVDTVNMAMGERGGYEVDSRKPSMIALKWCLIFFLPVFLVGAILFKKFKHKS